MYGISSATMRCVRACVSPRPPWSSRAAVMPKSVLALSRPTDELTAPFSMLPAPAARSIERRADGGAASGSSGSSAMSSRLQHSLAGSVSGPPSLPARAQCGALGDHAISGPPGISNSRHLATGTQRASDGSSPKIATERDSNSRNGSATHGSLGRDTDSSVNPEMSIIQEPFYEQVVSLISKMRLVEPSSPSEDRPVIKFHSPEELSNLLPLKLDPDSSALSRGEVFHLCERVAEYSVKTSHFSFRNQIFGGVDPFGFGGAILTEALNTNQHTFEVAPVFILCEKALLERVRQLIGWQQGDGITAAGGSMSNQYGLALARYRRYPDIKKHGMFGRKPLVLFTSQDAHYSIAKAAHWHGYGTDNVVAVETDSRGRMIPEALEAAVTKVQQEGREPLAVNATCGTTVLGSFDLLADIASVCEKHGLWLHVDAAWGGAALLSPKQRHLLAGIDRADSVAWNPHKMLGAPLQCSVFVTRHPGLLQQSNAASATYLFQQDKYYDVSFDTGDKSIQCGRKVDAFKLWLMWKAHGESGLASMIDDSFAAAEYCAQQIVHREGFRRVLDADVGSQCTNVCFWYVPERLRGREATAEWWAELARAAPRIKERMVRSGRLMVGYQPLPHKQLVNFFRLTFTAVPRVGAAEVDYILDQIDMHGRDV